MAINNFMSNNSFLRAITASFLGITLWFMLFYLPPLLFSLLIIIMTCIMITELKNMMLISSNFFLLVPFYPIIPCLILIYFNQSVEYKILLLYLFFMVFSFDTGSYLTGKMCSKLWKTHKIIPSVSPGKSWEGVCGGYLTTTSSLLINFMLDHKKICWHIYAISALLCMIAFAGDIFESYLKRSANIKDSGTLLPGHGGLLDRFDALLFVSYFFFIFKDYLLILLK